EHLEIGMLVHGSDVARLRGLDARADRRGALVVADDELVRRVGAELHHFRVGEADHLQVSHGMSPFACLSPSPSGRERAGVGWALISRSLASRPPSPCPLPLGGEGMRSYRPPPECIACQTRSGVTGMSRWRTPNGASASFTAFISAGSAPTVPASPTPLAPRGFTLVGTSYESTSKSGMSSARGIV